MEKLKNCKIKLPEETELANWILVAWGLTSYWIMNIIRHFGDDVVPYLSDKPTISVNH